MDRKRIFDAVRRLLGRGFRQAEVAALDTAINAAANGPGSTPRTVSNAGLALIKRFEGCARRRPDGLVEAYPDPGSGGSPWTIGWGTTGADVGPGTVWTQAQCDTRFASDLALYAAQVTDALAGAPTTQSQFDAMVSFHYNTGAIDRATLTRKHVAGDRDGAAREFARWTHAGGRMLPGLARRRAAEAALYRTTD